MFVGFMMIATIVALKVLSLRSGFIGTFLVLSTFLELLLEFLLYFDLKIRSFLSIKFFVTVASSDIKKFVYLNYYILQIIEISALKSQISPTGILY